MDRIESLERRRLLAAVTIAGDRVRIAGTSGDDAVSVSFLSKTVARITDGTTTTDIDLTTVKRLTFIGGAGNDLMNVGRVPLRCYMEGGTGDDSLSAGEGHRIDSLFGGDGNDYLYSGPGDDNLTGGLGSDFMIGNNGADFLQVFSEVSTDDTASGGEGDDTVSLATYDHGTTTTFGLLNPGLQLVITDTVYNDVENVIGSPFNDTMVNYSGRPLNIDAGDGNDNIFTGSGNDTIKGGLGNDSIVAGPGDDFIIADGGDAAIDTVVGGSGTDRAFYSEGATVKTVEYPLTQLAIGGADTPAEYADSDSNRFDSDGNVLKDD